MPVFEDNVAGITSVLTGDFLIDSTPDGSNSFAAECDDQAEVAYIIKEGTDYEEGVGTWDLASTSIINPVVSRSSNGNAAVVWGAGNKTIELVANSAMLKDKLTADQIQNLARLFAHKPDGEDIVIAITGQSQAGFKGWYMNGLPAVTTHPLVTDWNTDGAATPSPYGWQNPDVTSPFIDVPIVNEVHVGFQMDGRSNMAWRLAALLAEATGRRVRTIICWRGGTAIDEATGWTYNSTRDNCGGVMADTVDAALANLRAIAGNENVHSPDIAIWAHQQDPIAAPTVAKSAYYANELVDLVEAVENPDKWGWGDDKMQWLFTERPEANREQDPTFMGLELARSIIGAHRVHMVNTDGLANVPAGQHGEAYSIHWDGDSHDIVADRMFRILATPAEHSAELFAGFRYQRPMFELHDKQADMGYQAESSALPALFKWTYEDTGGGSAILRLTSLTTDSGGGFFNWWTNGGLSTYADGDVITVSERANPLVNLKRFQLTGSGTVLDSPDFTLEWPATIVLDSGTIPVDAPCMLTGSKKTYNQADTPELYSEANLRLEQLATAQQTAFPLAPVLESAEVRVLPDGTIITTDLPPNKFAKHTFVPLDEGITDIALDAITPPIWSSGVIKFGVWVKGSKVTYTEVYVSFICTSTISIEDVHYDVVYDPNGWGSPVSVAAGAGTQMIASSKLILNQATNITMRGEVFFGMT